MKTTLIVTNRGVVMRSGGLWPALDACRDFPWSNVRICCQKMRRTDYDGSALPPEGPKRPLPALDSGTHPVLRAGFAVSVSR